jgi:hypothetical protein
MEENDMIDVEDEDDYLLYLEDILRKVHSCFYKVYTKVCAYYLSPGNNSMLQEFTWSNEMDFWWRHLMEHIQNKIHEKEGRKEGGSYSM